uniref:Ig-like domain-containing protein n=1 Tax=Gopherus agassizii TaxID=38772 RepID=A0A452HGJ4_9SAUR
MCTVNIKNPINIYVYIPLFIIEPATITDKAVSIDVTEGDPATLQCRFSGTKDIAAKWFKDGKELTLGPKYKISVTDQVSALKIVHTEKKDSGEYTFEVQNDVGSSTRAKIEDSGIYVCEAHNDAGSESCSIELKSRVFFSFRVFLSCYLKPAEVVKGFDAMLECEVSGTPPFEVTWLKNNKEIRSSKKYAMSDKESVFTLAVTNCDFSDAGEYQCIISNDGGSCSCSTRVSLKGQFSYHGRGKTPTFSFLPTF